MNRINVNFCGVEFKNPVIPASGTFGYGREYEQFYPLSKLGGISVKGTTLHRREGNPGPRVAETPSGAELAEKLNGTAVDMIELNISCPNVKQGGAAFGTDCNVAGAVTKAVKDVTEKPLMVKLSPNVTSIVDIAKSVEANGADAVSLINTLLGMRIDIKTRRPILKNNVGGLSGPAVFPVAVRMVWQVANAVKIPVMGMGGIATWEDAIEMMMAGAGAVQVGAAIFADPYAPVKIAEGMQKFCEDNGIDNISEIVGTVNPW